MATSSSGDLHHSRTHMDHGDDDADSVSGSSYIGSDAPEIDTRHFDRDYSNYFGGPSHLVDREPSEISEDEEDTRSSRRVVEQAADRHSNPVTHLENESSDDISSDDESGGAPSRTNHENGAGARLDASPILVHDTGGSATQTRGAGAVGYHQTATSHRGLPGTTIAGPSGAIRDDTPARATQTSSQPSREPTHPRCEQNTTQQILPRTSESPLPDAPPPPPPPPREPLEARAVARHSRSQSEINRSGRGSSGANSGVDVRQPTFVLPRWQPDAEATLCPICHAQFGWINRKHHCRKCGRVVCSACSPHRITIPHQFIVQPPGAQRYPNSPTSGEGGYTDFSSLGGGERVRLCNPCVPDPNISPPAQVTSPRGGHTRAHSNFVGDAAAAHRRNSYARFPSSAGLGVNLSNRRVTIHDMAGPAGSTQSRILAGTPPYQYPAATASSLRSGNLYDLLDQHGSSSVATASSSRSQNLYDMLDQRGSSSTAAHHRRSLPPVPKPQPRYQIAEEDECPVCHRELPSRSLPNFEALRESHIASCIVSHSAYGASPARAPGNGEPTGEGSSSPPHQGGSPGPRPSPRRTGMFPYVATEKDCVDSAECTICLEEFEVGVPMARLECLCRFHRTCIAAWFVGHPGRCPVHQHDSFGY